MKKVVLTTLVFLGTNAALAGFGGNWMGTGRISNNRGAAANCERVQIKIEHTSTMMNASSTFTCGGKTIPGPGGLMTIRNGEAFLSDGTKIGTVTDTLCELRIETADVVMTSSEKIEGNNMIFKVINLEKKTGIVTTYDGVVTR